MRKKVFGVLQRIGRSFMLPIAVLPIAGMFLGLEVHLQMKQRLLHLVWKVFWEMEQF